MRVCISMPILLEEITREMDESTCIPVLNYTGRDMLVYVNKYACVCTYTCDYACLFAPCGNVSTQMSIMCLY